MENNESRILLEKDDTLVLKGIALLFLLIHHLFYQNDGLYNDIQLWKDHYLMQEIGIMSKVCVAIFVFLSGYGLAVGTKNNEGIPDLRKFYIHRFKKLFINYWFVWIVFVPVSYFCFGMTFEKAYQHQIGLQLIMDIFGVHEIFFGYPVYCYNPTWWFYSCIIVLYILFPLLYKWVCTDTISVLLASIAVSFLPIPHTDFIRFYLLAFVFGIIFVVKKLPPPINLWIPLAIFAIIMAERNLTKYPIFTDCLICVALVQLYRNTSLYKPIKQTLAFLGKHSMNIFLFHTFIFYFWFKEFIYASHNPIIIFVLLLSICLIISIGLEWIKKYTIGKL
ncbi:MAG: acyltransferase [Prevotella sp.]|nr:acyltransferase [Prevotella sp.]